MRYHCCSCCSPLSKVARERFSSWLESLLALSKLAQHFPLVGQHLHRTNKGRVINKPVPADAAIFGGGDARKEARTEEIDGIWVVEREPKIEDEWRKPGEPNGANASKTVTISQ